MGETSRLAEQALVTAIPPEFADSATSFHGLAGRSPAMRQLIRQMQRMAPHLAVATLEGEDGAGKSLAARALHAAGPAAHGPFVPCLATHFFRSFDADADLGWSTDLFQQADRGMLFLDRVNQLDARQQEVLDDFLHHWEDRRWINGRGAREPGSRVASASSRPLQIVFSSSTELKSANELPGAGYASIFRVDLASKLCAVRFRLPPLRERREDIPLLAQLFLQRFSQTYGKQVRGLGPGTIAPLLRHAWLGNVRELEEVMIAAAVETESQWIRPIDLPKLAADNRLRSIGEGEKALAENASETLDLDQAISAHVHRVLDRVRGNKLRAAQLLGISRSTLYRILGNSSENPPVTT
jgi:DNA-binding NtrC family response regulator